MQITILLQQISIAVASTIVAAQTITAVIHGVFHIENSNVVHWISWIVAVLCGLGFVAFNGLDFGVSTTWNYILGGVTGLLAGGAANGLYDWPSIQKIFDAITNAFTPKKYRK